MVAHVVHMHNVRSWLNTFKAQNTVGIQLFPRHKVCIIIYNMQIAKTAYNSLLDPFIYIYMYYIYVYIVWGHDDLVHFKHCSERIQHIQSTSFLFEYTDCVHVSLSIFILYVYYIYIYINYIYIL